MKLLKDISLVGDCDASTLERAAMLAKENRAKLTIVLPVKELPKGSNPLRLGEKSIDLAKLVLHEYESMLAEVAKSVRSLGVRPATKVLVGKKNKGRTRTGIVLGRTRTGIVLLHGVGGFGNVIHQIETTFARGEVFYDDTTTFKNRRSERDSLVPLHLQVRPPCLAHR